MLGKGAYISHYTHHKVSHEGDNEEANRQVVLHVLDEPPNPVHAQLHIEQSSQCIQTCRTGFGETLDSVSLCFNEAGCTFRQGLQQYNSTAVVIGKYSSA